ncbi:hypothetical protein D3C80_2163320 [compost metagenome]
MTGGSDPAKLKLVIAILNAVNDIRGVKGKGLWQIHQVIETEFVPVLTLIMEKILDRP